MNRMHELSIAEQILDILAEEAALLEVREVLSATVRVGRLVQVEPDNLLFCLGVLKEQREETRNTEFVIEEEPLDLVCRECGHRTVASDLIFLCAACHSGKVDVLAGDSLEVSSMEVDLFEGGCQAECDGGQ